MGSNKLLSQLNTNELVLNAVYLMAWEMGVVTDMDSVAQYMYRDGPWPPQASARPPSNLKTKDDPRPDKKYWHLVKEELTAFLCTNNKKYKELWSRIDSLEKKGTSGIVLVVSAYLGEKFGMQASILAGFVAVFFYGVIKVGKEAYCRLALSNET